MNHDNQHQGDAANNRLYPLQREGRYRNPEVVRQILRFQDCSSYEFWRCAELKDYRSSDYVQNETLIYLIRDNKRKGNENRAWQLTEFVMERCAARIRKMIWKVYSRENMEDCLREIQLSMAEAILSLEGRHEFWEINFATALQRLALNILPKYQRPEEQEVSLSSFQTDDGESVEHESWLRDWNVADAQQRAEIAELLARLSENERNAIFYFHVKCWPQQKIADYFGVTERTIRNWLVSAKRRLADAYNETHD